MAMPPLPHFDTLREQAPVLIQPATLHYLLMEKSTEWLDVCRPAGRITGDLGCAFSSAPCRLQHPE
jgi:hypothetical protein